MTQKVCKWRNLAIIFLCVELGSVITGIGTYTLRRSKVILFANMVALIINFVGFVGALKCNLILSLTHALTTMNLIGAFFIY